jgi:hypothetical protein
VAIDFALYSRCVVSDSAASSADLAALSADVSDDFADALEDR